MTTLCLKPLVSAITLLALLNLVACTTTGTQKQILNEPMSADLEAQVMRETGISGAVTGAVVGGLAVGGLTFLALAASGRSMEESLIGGAVGAVAGATGGGLVGYQMGKKEGQKTVAQAMDRDQVAKYLQGARAYNEHLAQTNTTLASELRSARKIENPRLQKSRLIQVERATRTELKSVDERVSAREKAIANLKWPGEDKAAYQKELVQLKQERDQLRQTLLKASSQEAVTL